MSTTRQKDYEYTLTVPATPDRVWRALIDERALRIWFAERVEVEPRLGGAYRFWGRNTLGTTRAEEATQRIESFEPHERLGFTWSWAGVRTRVEIGLAATQWKEWTMGSNPPRRPPQPGCAVSVRQRFEGVLPYDRPENLVDDHWRLALGNLWGHLDGGSVALPDYSDPDPRVRLSIHIAAPPAAVFRALTVPALLDRWLAMDARVDLRSGGSLDLGWSGCAEPAPDGYPMKILELATDRRLTISWPDWRGQPEEPDTRVSFELVPEAGGTRVEFTHDGFRRAVDRSDYQQGWGSFLEGLRAVVLEAPA